VVLALWFRSLLNRVPRSVEADRSRPGAHWWLLGSIALASLTIGVARAWLAWQTGAAVSYYRVAYLLLTRSIGWFAALYLAAGILVMSSRRRPVLTPESP
jgi:hypothetical protein